MIITERAPRKWARRRSKEREKSFLLSAGGSRGDSGDYTLESSRRVALGRGRWSRAFALPLVTAHPGFASWTSALRGSGSEGGQSRPSRRDDDAARRWQRLDWTLGWTLSWFKASRQ